jgi:hypothetical protein
MPSSP